MRSPCCQQENKRRKKQNMYNWSVMTCLPYYILGLLSGLLPREPPAGSGSEAHYPSATHTLRHPLQVQQGWVQDEGAGACALGLLCKNTLVSIPWVTCVLLSNRKKNEEEKLLLKDVDVCLSQVIMLSSITELHSYIDRTQLTQELGGTQEYCHEKWISHRTVCTVQYYPLIIRHF